MTRIARDRSERLFLYFIGVIVLILIIGMFYNMPNRIVQVGLFSILGFLVLRGGCLSGRPEGEVQVISQIVKDK